MRRDGLVWALIAGLLAIGISPLVTVLSGTVYLSALVLLPIGVAVWLITRPSRRDLGITLGSWRQYAVGVAYPVGVMGLIILLLWRFKGIRLEEYELGRVIFVISVNTLGGILGGLLTEEGFFRGLVWGLLRTKEYRGTCILLITSVVFVLWHIPVAFLEFGEGFPRSAIPVYLGNVLLLGLNWGLLRLASGSVFVPAVSHALWNALAYKLFGFGVGYGLLVRSSFRVFDPERGLLGVGLNGLFLVVYWVWIFKKRHQVL